jgi:hypothetical protein
MHPEVQSFIDRLRTVPEYATEQGISLVQAHRRIKEGKAHEVKLRGKVFVLLPDNPVPSPPPSL